MIKRLLSILFFMAICYTLWPTNAQEISLDREHPLQTIQYGELKITAELVSNNSTDVKVSAQNLSDKNYFIFKYDQNEKELKKNYKPIITFDDKSFSGTKGHRTVNGCNLLSSSYYNLGVYSPKPTKLFDIDVPSGTEATVQLYFYSAQYKKGGFLKKEKYQLLRDHPMDLRIKVTDWDETDPTYQKTLKAVDGFIYELGIVQVCENRNHPESLAAQYARYEAKRDSLIEVILKIQQDGWWQVDQKPGKKYNELSDKLKGVDIRKTILKVKKCPKDKATQSCNHCKQYNTAEKVYKRFDNIYQQLYTGKITKDAAVSTVKSLYNCYKNHKRGDKASFNDKIEQLYNRIMDY